MTYKIHYLNDFFVETSLYDLNFPKKCWVLTLFYIQYKILFRFRYITKFLGVIFVCRQSKCQYESHLNLAHLSDIIYN